MYLKKLNNIMEINLLVFSLILFQVGDILTTSMALSYEGFKETNPYVKDKINTQWLEIILFKLTTTLIAIGFFIHTGQILLFKMINYVVGFITFKNCMYLLLYQGHILLT